MKHLIPLFSVLAACGDAPYDAHRTFRVRSDIRAPALQAQTALNALIGCEILTLVDDESQAALGNGVSEIFFTTGLASVFDGLTLIQTSETDILIRPKPDLDALALRGRAPAPDYTGKILHELGHAYGLGHVPTDDIMNINGGDWHDAATMARFKAALVGAGVRCELH